MSNSNWFGEDLHIPLTYRIRVEYKLRSTVAPPFMVDMPLPSKYYCLMNDDYLDTFQRQAEAMGEELINYIYWYLDKHKGVKTDKIQPFSLDVRFIDKDKYNG